MKVFISQNVFFMAGKPWEIREKLKLYAKKHVYVKELIEKAPPNNCL